MSYLFFKTLLTNFIVSNISSLFIIRIKFFLLGSLALSVLLVSL